MFGEFHNLFKELLQDLARFSFLIFMYVRCDIEHFVNNKPTTSEEVYKFQESYFAGSKALCHTEASTNGKATI
jgi:hypothetical protein